MGAVRTKRKPRAVREQQMLDAAVQLFGQRGYMAASMDEIAERAGVSKPLVYLYLNSKEDLFSACIRREAAALTEAVRSKVHPDMPADRQLWEGLRAFFAHTAQHPEGWTVLHRQARTQGEPFAAEVAAVRAEFIAFVAQLILDAVRDGTASCASTAGSSGERHGPERYDPAQHRPERRDPQQRGPGLPEREAAGLAEALVGAAESLAAWANATPGVTARQAAAILMNFAWAGLSNLMEGRAWSPPSV